MTAEDIVARLKGSRATGNGRWLARCPVHSDHRPSLSVAESAGAMVLVKCFAGCSTPDIVRALGLTMAHLFPSERIAIPSRRDSNRITTITGIEGALSRQIERILISEAARLGYRPPVLAIHENAARRTVERRLGVQLKRIKSPWFEVLPHAFDPAWQACIDQALQTRAAASNIDPRTIAAAISDLPKTAAAVLDDAVALLRELAGAEC